MDAITAGALGAHLLSLALLIWTAGRVGLSERMLLFLVLFYSIAPLVPFAQFQFFRYELDYEYDAPVLLTYAAVALFFAVLAFAVCSFPPPSLDGSDAGVADALRGLWWLSLAAWLIDTSFNWRYFFLPKHEYILSIPEQTKNLFLFTIPARELLAGALVFCPFRSPGMRRIAVLVALLATVHSLVIGVRHVVLLVLLLLLLPRLRSLGVLLLCAALTFAGELSNVVKLLLSLDGGIQANPFDPAWWGTYLSENLGVSVEQKAILSNLLIKLSHPELLEYGQGLRDMLVGVFGSIVSRIGFEFPQSASQLGAFVGTLPGQGTAYSLHVSVIESFGLVLAPVVAVAFLARVTLGNMLFILAGEVMYSMMRNGPDFWLSQVNKLVFLIAAVWLAAESSSLLRRRTMRLDAGNARVEGGTLGG